MDGELQRVEERGEHTACGAATRLGFALDAPDARGATSATTAPGPAGARLGIPMLETRFERVPGDIGNPANFDFPVRYAVVAGASPQRAVREGEDALLQVFVEAGLALVAQGASAITASCGFQVLDPTHMPPYADALRAACRCTTSVPCCMNADVKRPPFHASRLARSAVEQLK